MMTLWQAKGVKAHLEKKKSWTIADRVAMRNAAQVLRYHQRRKFKGNPMSLKQATEARLSEIADIAESGVTEMTGKLRRGGDRDDVVGRFGGMKPAYPELNQLSAGPKAIAASIRKGKGKAYRSVYTVVEAAMAKAGYKNKRKSSPGRQSVNAHSGRKSCTHCGELHTTSEHRFHGSGSFHRTHAWGFNPPAGRSPVMIYGRVLLIQAQKTQRHVCDAECKKCEHCYVHEFQPGAAMWGLPNGDILIRSKK